MAHHENKYWVEDSDLLSEVEKTRMAHALRELESRGVLEYRDGRWGFAAGVEIDETPDGLVTRVRNAEEGNN